MLDDALLRRYSPVKPPVAITTALAASVTARPVVRCSAVAPQASPSRTMISTIKSSPMRRTAPAEFSRDLSARDTAGPVDKKST